MGIWGFLGLNLGFGNTRQGRAASAVWYFRLRTMYCILCMNSVQGRPGDVPSQIPATPQASDPVFPT